jgi:ketosteroid isomerase-like protein
MASSNSQTLEALWDHLSTMNSSSPETAYERYLEFFTPTATVYLSGMSQPPTTSYDSLKTAIKTLLTYWGHLDRKIVHHVEGEDGSVVNAMENKLLIAGDVVDGFKECEVVRFEGGKISQYLLYCDPAPIIAVFAKKAQGKE